MVVGAGIAGLAAALELQSSGSEVSVIDPADLGIGTDTARLPAERNSRGDGRVYHVSFKAEDGRGGECTGSVKVCVPKGGGRGRPAAIAA